MRFISQLRKASIDAVVSLARKWKVFSQVAGRKAKYWCGNICEWVKYQRFSARIKNLLRWFAEAGMLWLAILVILVPMIVLLFLDSVQSKHIRWFGLLWQLMGIFTVAKGLSDTRKLFGQVSLFRRGVKWLRKLPGALRRPKSVTVSARGVSVVVSASDASVTSGLSSDASLEERIKCLERDFNELRNELNKYRTEFKSDLSEVREGLQKERSERIIQDSLIMDKLEAFSVGGLYLETIGLIWLVLGLICSTIPDELALLFSL